MVVTDPIGNSDRSVQRTRVLALLLRWRDVVLLLCAAALVFLVLVVSGVMTANLATLAFTLVCAGVLLGARLSHERNAASPTKSILPELGPTTIEAIVDALPDPVIAIDRGGQVIAFNTLARTAAPALTRGQPAVLALRAPEIVEAIRRAGSTGQAQKAEFLEQVPVTRWFEAFIVPLPLHRGSQTHAPDLMLITIHDLTRMRLTEEMRVDFVANASHELRTPLAALSGFIETLQGPASDDRVAREKFLRIMHSQATRMARLIDDLLSLSRIELNAHVRPDKPTDLVSVVRVVIDGLQTLATSQHVTMHVHGGTDPLVVLGERDELIRVFENLIQNALKYGATGQRVDIRFDRAKGPNGTPEARIAVQDYGPGIAPEHLPRLTERFYRVDVAGSRAQGGTGLGLSLVKHILNRHGGRLTIESTYGSGATFTVSLPLVGQARTDRL